MEHLNIFLECMMDCDGEAVLSNVYQRYVEEINAPVNLGLMTEMVTEERAKNEDYYEITIPRYNDFLFKEHFRMSRSTFERLQIVIGNTITGRRDAFADFTKKCLFTIWVLAKPESFLAAGDRFGMAKGTAYKVFREIVATTAGLLSAYVKFPSRSQMVREAQIFQRRTRGFPGIVGVVDGCHIPIKAPVGNAIDYYNRNKIHSIILQGTCDHKARFVDVYIGMPGRMHDAMVFRNSDLCSKLNDAENPLIPLNFHLVGDSAYALHQNLMTPFRDNGRLSARQTNYNVKLSTGRSIIERAYGLLKGKFRRLKYLDISSPTTGNEIIAAACVLHNFLIDSDEVNFEDEIICESSNEESFSQDGAFDGNTDDANAVAKRNGILASLP